jgi:predicted RNA binding protein YcfA (HicA-like mRNA interferase family)
MSNVPSLTPSDIIRLLMEKGFVLDRTSGSHRIFLHPISNKRVVVPFHKKDLPTGTMLSILKQAGISKDELSKK